MTGRRRWTAQPVVDDPDLRHALPASYPVYGSLGAVQTKLPRLELIVLCIAFVVLVLDAGGGPGWSASASSSVLAARMTHLASAPLYDVLASLAALLPFGEVGFRLGVLDAALGALTLAGVVATVRALVPRDIGAAVVTVGVLLIAPPFRDAAAFASPSILVACGAVWSFACAARYASTNGGDARDAIAALAACAVVVGSAPWLGAALTIAFAAWLWRSGAREPIVLGIGALGLFVVVWWFDAAGSLPSAAGSLAATVGASGRGAAAIVVGAGLLGIGFGALTGLRNTRWLAVVVALVALHEIVIGATAPALLALLAIGVAIIPSAILRATQPKLEGMRRHALAFGAGVPLLAIAAALGGTFTVDDPGDAPTQLATDLTSALPPGPGIFIATRSVPYVALQYEATIAGARPDLVIAPPMAEQQADGIAADALRARRVVGADAPSFGRLDVRLAVPRGRGFQLVSEPPTLSGVTVTGPAQYASSVGRDQAIVLALERARYEAANQRLDVSARALGLEARFGAADLAVLAATLPSRERPALFGFLPLDAAPPGTWMLDVFADDLAWVGGIPIPPVDDRAPMPRRLHAKWRDILLGKATPDDPGIVALGPRAVATTKALFTEKKQP
jgi:hypothetical protein